MVTTNLEKMADFRTVFMPDKNRETTPVVKYVEIVPSDTHYLRLQVRQSRSFSLVPAPSSPSQTHPIRLFPHVNTQSIDQICNSVPQLFSFCFPYCFFDFFPPSTVNMGCSFTA